MHTPSLSDFLTPTTVIARSHRRRTGELALPRPHIAAAVKKENDWHDIRSLLHEHGAVIGRTESGTTSWCPAPPAALTWLWMHSLKGERHLALPDSYVSRASNNVWFMQSQGDGITAFDSVSLRHKLPRPRDVFDKEGNVTTGFSSLVPHSEGLPLYIRPDLSLDGRLDYFREEVNAKSRRSTALRRGKVSCYDWLTSQCAEHDFVALMRDTQESNDHVDVFQGLSMTGEEMSEMQFIKENGDLADRFGGNADDYFSEAFLSQAQDGTTGEEAGAF